MPDIDLGVPEELLEKLNRLSDEEGLDRSTVIRRLLERGYDAFMLERAADQYRRGDITISEVADRAECTLCEMERHLVRAGYTSDYSIADLAQETETLRSRRNG